MNAFNVLGRKALSAGLTPFSVVQLAFVVAAFPIAHVWLSADAATHQQRVARRTERFQREHAKFREAWVKDRDGNPPRVEIIQGPPIMPWLEWTGFFFDVAISTAGKSWTDYWAVGHEMTHLQVRAGNAIWLLFAAIFAGVSLIAMALYPVIYFAVFVCGPYRGVKGCPSLAAAWGREIVSTARGFVQFVETGDVQGV